MTLAVRDHLPNPLAETLNVKARFDNSEAKFDSTIAVVDGPLYRMEPFTLRPERFTEPHRRGRPSASRTVWFRHCSRNEACMDQPYEYYAIVTLAYPWVEDPALVCRRRTDEAGRVCEEAFTSELAWVPSTELSRVESGEGKGEAHPITAEAASRFEKIQHFRIVDQAPVNGDYVYFAWVDGNSSATDPAGVIRTWTSRQGFELEQYFDPDLRWRSSDLRDDIRRGREGGSLVEITEEDVERFKELLAERRRSQG